MTITPDVDAVLAIREVETVADATLLFNQFKAQWIAEGQMKEAEHTEQYIKEAREDEREKIANKCRKKIELFKLSAED